MRLPEFEIILPPGVTSKRQFLVVQLKNSAWLHLHAEFHCRINVRNPERGKILWNDDAPELVLKSSEAIKQPERIVSDHLIQSESYSLFEPS